MQEPQSAAWNFLNEHFSQALMFRNQLIANNVELFN